MFRIMICGDNEALQYSSHLAFCILPAHTPASGEGQVEPTQTPLRTEASLIQRSEVTSLPEPRKLWPPRPSGPTEHQGRLSPLQKDLWLRLGNRGTPPGAFCETEEKRWSARPLDQSLSPHTSAVLRRPPALMLRRRAVTAVTPGPPQDLHVHRSVTRATCPKATADHWFCMKMCLEGFQEETR